MEVKAGEVKDSDIPMGDPEAGKAEEQAKGIRRPLEEEEEMEVEVEHDVESRY
jgi:hypothetical protein